MTKIKQVKSHVWERQAEEHYIEPVWVSEQLFRVEPFFGPVHDPCCGVGRIPIAARKAGHKATGSDIVDRGFPGVTIEPFLGTKAVHANIAMNPPFDQIREFCEHACARTEGKVACISPTRRLNAAGAWLRQLPLIQIWYLTPRPSMPPGHVVLEHAARGEEPAGGTADFCWLVFQKSAPVGMAPRIGWLHRDKGRL